MPKRKTQKAKPEEPKKPVELKEKVKKSSPKKATPIGSKKEVNKPNLRSIYSNSKNTLMPLGFGSDFKTKKCVVIFSDLLTGQVHTAALSVWNRLKLKEVKKINPQT